MFNYFAFAKTDPLMFVNYHTFVWIFSGTVTG